MTVKEYLSQAFVLRKLVRAKESRIQDLRERQVSLGGALSDVRVQTSIVQDTVGSTTAALLDLIAECRQDIEELIRTQREIELTIKMVGRNDLQLVLFERYVNLKNWEDIAADNNYSWDTVHRKHRAALAWIEKSVWNRTLHL